VVTGVPLDSSFVKEEMFGPVVTVEPFFDDTDAVQRANATPHARTVGVWTSDLDRAWRLARAVRAGSVWVNGYAEGYPALPRGGVGPVLGGRHGGPIRPEHFTEFRDIHVAVPRGRRER
jgi:acyl-CoA reductase-like NAD-dependent aldehyde dehydrogenase